MIDIAIIALPADRERAETILDGLHEAQVAGANRTRFMTEHPLGAGWMEAIRTAENCPCVIFCWSHATNAPDAEPLRALGVQILAAKHAISVLLDVGTLPLAMAGSTVYPLHGWRSTLGGWGRFVFGDSYLKQIATAAARKVSGQDPPPPQAIWVMFRAQAWALMLGAFAVLGTASTLWAVYNDTNIAKLTDKVSAAEYAKAKASRSCSALRQLIATHQDSPWAADAQTLVASCHMVQKIVAKRDETSLPAFGDTLAAADADAKRLCEGYARTINGSLKNYSLTDFVAGKTATARCIVDHDESEPVEVMGENNDRALHQ